MANSKKIKFINYIIINGERIQMDSLSTSEKEQIAIQLNDQAMRALGYERSN